MSAWRRSANAAASTSGPSSDLAVRFHTALRSGNIGAVRELVFKSPKLANVRDPRRGFARAPPLLAATVCSGGANKAVTLVNLLVAKGARLLTKDDRKWTVLMFACANGAHPSVVQCLLEWSRKESRRTGSSTLTWSDVDTEGRTALVLACTNGHGRLAGYLLDKVISGEDCADHPLRLLLIAIDIGDEDSVLELLHSRLMQRAVRSDHGIERMRAHGEWSQASSALDGDWSVTSCTSAAVRGGMGRVIETMHRLNPNRVGRATWLTAHRLQTTRLPVKRGRSRPPAPIILAAGIATVIDRHKRDTVWQSIKPVYLIRNERGRAFSGGNYAKLGRLLATLPNDLFRVVVEFVKSPFDDEAEAQKEQFRVLMNDSW